MFNYLEIFSHMSLVALLVMFILLAFSVISWAIILSKWQSIKNMLVSNASFIDLFWQTKDLSSLVNTNTISPSLEVFKDGVLEYERQKNKSENKQEAFLVIERALVRSARKQIKKADSKLSFLATIGSVSPFIGLFGTVVGIMSSFNQIGQAGNANLATVAPGIAEALLATAIGLFAAIPAVMAYNIFQTRLKTLKADLDNFCLDLLAVLKSQK
jgi:biopolymer transport protein TolQ